MQIFPGPSELALHRGPWIGCQSSLLARTLLAELLQRPCPRIYLLGPADSGKTHVLTDICRDLGLQVSWSGTDEHTHALAGTRSVVLEGINSNIESNSEAVDWPAPSPERLSALAQLWLDENRVSYEAAAVARLAELGQRGLTPLRGICQRAAHVSILNRSRLSAALVEEAAWAYDPHPAS